MTDIAAIIKVFMEPGLKPDSPTQATLRPGSVLNGRITDILPSGLVQINFGKFRTQARVRFPVAKGDTLRFEVLETGDPIKLKIQEPPPSAIKEPVERFFKPEDLQRFRQALETVLQKPGAPLMDRGSADSTRLLLARLSNHLLPLQAGRETGQLAPLIKSTLTNSGIFFEKRLETVLLQIFKSPDRINAGRAVSHPFITNIFDSDLKPNLLKLAAVLSKTGGSREQTLASIHAASLKFLDHINAEQARITRHAPTGPAKRTATYHRSEAPPPGLPTGTLKTLQLRLVKSGLWADPDIRAVTREFINSRGLETKRYTAFTTAQKGLSGPVTPRLPPGAEIGEKIALREGLAGLVKDSAPAPSAKTLEPLLKAFQAYVRENRFTLEPKTEKALIQLENSTRNPASRAAAAAPVTGQRAEDAKQHLRTLARFIENRPAAPLKASPPVPGKPGKALVPDKRVAAGSREIPRTSTEPGRHAATDRAAPKAADRGPRQVMDLVAPKAAALTEELNRLDKELARVLSDNTVRPDGKKTARIARTLRTLIGRHQLSADDTVNRALAAVASGDKPSKAVPASALKTGTLSERLPQDLMVLREFIGQQKIELNETLNIFRALLGRTVTESDPGDRPGPERARGADPVQVIAFSLPMEEGQRPARLKVFYPLKKRASTETGFRISLLLSMERMGPIRADIITHQNNLEIRFSTENEPARHHIGDHLNRLNHILNGHFATVNLTAAVDEKTIAAFEYEDLELSGNRLVNLQV